MTEREPFGQAVRRAVSPTAIPALLAVPVALIAVFTLPAATRQSLGFSHADPTLVSAYTAHFVHLNATHLGVNLAVYLTVAPVVYLTSALGERERLFTVAFTAYLLAFPFVLSALNLALARNAVEFGFSGIAMALFGLLPLSLSAFASVRLDDDLDTSESPALFFIALAAIALVADPTDPRTVGIGVTAALAAMLYSGRVLGQLRLPGRSGMRRAADRAGDFELATVGSLLLVAVPLIAFGGSAPAVGVTNSYVHLLGFALGYVPAYVTVTVAEHSSPVGVDI
ncbi:hypothetical protein BRD16_09695 [Halobacteriales archaeon SW_6_65_46]|nr:MAG: hypothetical protein BRD16_09695 [Halobacteriales archaeon SW_6_65_46]